MKFLYHIKAILLTCFLSSFSNLSFAIDAERYVIDSTHSSVEFSIRHFVAKTNGNFSTFEGFIDIDTNDPTKYYTEAQISIKSVNTNSTKRDAHLQEADYFNSSSNPLIEFESTNWAKNQANDTFLVEGILTMNGVSKTVTLDVTLLGLGEGFNGQKLSGWEGTTTLNRTDWNILGGLGAVGEMVDIRINIEAYRK
jgi:polyisoprenoid-binding protein YceI